MAVANPMWPPDTWSSQVNGSHYPTSLFFEANDPLQHLWNPGGPTPSVQGGGGGQQEVGQNYCPESEKEYTFFRLLARLLWGN